MDCPTATSLVTLHRPANVDNDQTLKRILGYLLELNSQLEVVFPVHPRTRQRIAEFGFDANQLICGNRCLTSNSWRCSAAPPWSSRTPAASRKKPPI